MSNVIQAPSAGRVKGHYRLEVREVGTNNLKQVREFDNLITDHLLKLYSGQYSSTNIFIVVGTGTTTPYPEATDMGNQIAYKQFKYSEVICNPTAPDYVSGRRLGARFNAGDINNTITEVGMTNQGNNKLCTWALITDDNGNLSPVTVGANEYLDVYYELYYYPDLTETTGSFVLDGTTYQYVAKPYAITNHVLHGISGIYSVWAAIYDSSAKVEDITYAYDGTVGKQCSWSSPENTDPRTVTYKLELNEGNFSDNLIGGARISTIGYSTNWSISTNTRFVFTPAIPKDNTCTLQFTFALPTFRRYTAP